MSAQASILGRRENIAPASGIQRPVLFAVFLICGAAIFVFGSNYFTVFPTNQNPAYNVVLSAIFLVAAVWLKRNERLNKYWQVAFAFFIASFAFLFTSFFSGLRNAVLDWFNLTTSTS